MSGMYESRARRISPAGRFYFVFDYMYSYVSYSRGFEADVRVLRARLPFSAIYVS
jgi:hypothetical protein